MTRSHKLLHRQPNRRLSQLAIVVLPDETTAFQVYRLLHQHGISPENLAIVGNGYSTPERVGLQSPFRLILRKASFLALNAMVMGAVLSLAVLLLWKVAANTFLVVVLTSLVCGACGALVGTILGIWGEGGTASIYRYHLSKGRYLLLIEGSKTLVAWGEEILSYYITHSVSS